MDVLVGEELVKLGRVGLDVHYFSPYATALSYDAEESSPRVRFSSRSAIARQSVSNRSLSRSPEAASLPSIVRIMCSVCSAAASDARPSRAASKISRCSRHTPAAPPRCESRRKRLDCLAKKLAVRIVHGDPHALINAA